MNQPPDKPANSSPQTPTEFHTPEADFQHAGEESQFSDHGHDLVREEQDFREPELASDLDVGAAHEELAKETAGQNQGFVPVPFSLLVVFGLVVLWAGVYLGTYSGGFSGKVFTEKPGQGGKSGPVAPPDPVKIGEKLFNANCAQCHQQTGLGQAGQFPPLAASEWVLGSTNRLTHILVRGIQGSIHVKGGVYNNQMPAWNTLKDEQIAGILSYIRQAWGNSAPPITKDQVAAGRKDAEPHGEAYTEGELLAMPEGGEAGAPQKQTAGPPAGTTQQTAPANGNPPPDPGKKP